MRLLYIILPFILCCGQKSSLGNNDNGSISESNPDTLLTGLPDNHDTNCSYDNQVSTLGIGLVIVPSKFEIYNDSLLSNKLLSFDMYEDEPKMNICPKFFKPDYGIMHFVCIEKTAKFYKVLVNYSDVKYLPKAHNYDFKTWEQYILQSYGLKRISNNGDLVSKSLPLRIEPRENADTLSIPKGYEMFCPIEVKGDWVKVTYDCFYNDVNSLYEGQPCHDYIDKCEKPLIGWLKWKDKNNLKIETFLMP